MSVEAIEAYGDNEVRNAQTTSVPKFQRCLRTFIHTKDKNILVAAYGLFMCALGIVLTVGYFVILATTTSTAHTETPIPTIVSSTMIILSGVLFSSLVFRKPRYMIFITIFLSTISGILSAIGTVHFGMAVGKRLTALSSCMYTTVTKLCTCSVNSPTARVMYNFENTSSCDTIKTHLREVVYGICGVYAITFLACFGAAVYGILLLHKIEIKKIKSQQTQSEITIKEPLKEKKGFGEDTPEVLPHRFDKRDLPWQQDAATQTSEGASEDDLSSRQQCRHFVEVTVPSSSSDYVVNITKSRDPPPPYCETVYS